MLWPADEPPGAETAGFVGLSASEVEVAHDASGCATLTLSGRPLSSAEARELTYALHALLEDRSVRVVQIESAGESFCPGAAPDLDPLAVQQNPAVLLAGLPVPVIAALRGEVASVGLELALTADFRIASADACFSMPDLQDGAIPCWGGTQRLPRIAGRATATAMILLGERLTASAAHECGLVSEIAADPSARAVEIATRLRTLAPLALSYAKEAVLDGAELPMRDGMRLEADLNALLSRSRDRAEGLDAFKHKRAPDFDGR